MTAAKKKTTDIDSTIDDTNVNNENEEGEKEMSETIETKTQTIITNGNGNGNKLSDIRPIDLSQKEYESLLLTPEKLNEIVIPRLSRIRTKAELVSRVRSGKIKIDDPSTIINWSFKNVQVTGVSVNSRGVKEPKVLLSKDQFNNLTNDEKADLIEKHTRERRASEEIFPALLKLGMKLSAYDAVYLTNGRLSIENVVVEGHTNRQPTIVDGVTFE